MMNESIITEEPKQIVWDMMINFSERTSSCRWRSGIEFSLWKKIRECSDDLSLREIADLNFYAGLAGGWWMWDDDQKSEVFIELSRWLLIYNSSLKE